MVAPIIGAILRAAAGQAGKKAAMSAAKKAAAKSSTAEAAKIVGKEAMQKAGEKGAKQAANRFANAAGRYLKDAERVAGEIGENGKPRGMNSRYAQLFKKAATRVQHFEKQLRTADLSNGFSDYIDNLISKSDAYLAKASRGRESRGDLLGETLLDGTMQGHRFFAATKSIWEEVGYENRYDAIKEAFEGKNLAEIIKEIEDETGVNIMKGDINSPERYGKIIPIMKISPSIPTWY